MLLHLGSEYASTLNSGETTKMQCKTGHFQSKFLMLSSKYILTQHALLYCKFFPLFLLIFYSPFLIQKTPHTYKKETAQPLQAGRADGAGREWNKSVLLVHWELSVQSHTENPKRTPIKALSQDQYRTEPGGNWGQRLDAWGLISGLPRAVNLQTSSVQKPRKPHQDREITK